VDFANFGEISGGHFACVITSTNTLDYPAAHLFYFRLPCCAIILLFIYHILVVNCIIIAFIFYCKLAFRHLGQSPTVAIMRMDRWLYYAALRKELEGT